MIEKFHAEQQAIVTGRDFWPDRIDKRIEALRAEYSRRMAAVVRDHAKPIKPPTNEADQAATPKDQG